MGELKLFKDAQCSEAVPISGVTVTVSGDSLDSSLLATDGDEATHWHPQCDPCAPEEAWISVQFASDTTIMCAEAANLGQAAGEGANQNKAWSDGIVLQYSDDGVTWAIAVSGAHGTNLAVVPEPETTRTLQWNWAVGATGLSVTTACQSAYPSNAGVTAGAANNETKAYNFNDCIEACVACEECIGFTYNAAGEILNPT